MKSNKNKAAIYVRRSATDARDAHGPNRSIASQRREIEDLAKRHNLDIVKIYEERVGTSASHLKDNARPKFDAMLNEMGAEWGTLLTWALDRGSRKGMAEAGKIVDRIEDVDGRWLTVDGIDTDQSGARLTIAIKAEMARDEMASLSSRVKRGKEEQRRRGEYQGGSVVFGLMAVRTPNEPTVLVPDPDAVAMIREAADAILAGATTTQICKKWNSEGKKTSNNSNWTSSTLLRVFKNPAMIGHRKALGDVLRNDDGSPMICTEPLLDEATYQRVISTLAQRSSKATRHNKKNKTQKRSSVLSGLLVCKQCGGKLWKQPKKTNTRGYITNAAYRCTPCKGVVVGGDAIETIITEAALTFLMSLEPDSAIKQEVARRWLHQYSGADMHRRSSIEDEAAVIEGRLKKLRDSYYEKLALTDEEFEEREGKLLAKLAPLEAELIAMPATSYDTSPLDDLIACGDNPETLTGEGSAWAALELFEQQEVLRCIIEIVEITKGRKYHPNEDLEERVAITFATPENTAELGDRNVILSKNITRAAKLAPTS